MERIASGITMTRYHTILLPKKEILVQMAAFNYSGFDGKVLLNLPSSMCLRLGFTRWLYKFLVGSAHIVHLSI